MYRKYYSYNDRWDSHPSVIEEPDSTTFNMTISNDDKQIVENNYVLDKVTKLNMKLKL